MIEVVRVFPAGPDGGNPAPIVLDAEGMSDAEMQAVARSYGHESGFVVDAPEGFDLGLRFWVPNHEMEMCGHATVGAVWLLHHHGRLPRDEVKVWTRSGAVVARVDGGLVEITQPEGVVEPLADEDAAAVQDVLGVSAVDGSIRNASTSRVKTLVPMPSVEALDGLRPDFGRIQAVCEVIGSTGLYPYAVQDRDNQVVRARQFPRSSGYPEDAATGIAAAALCCALHQEGWGGPIRVRQGQVMGRPSEMVVRFRAGGLWLGGRVDIG